MTTVVIFCTILENSRVAYSSLDPQQAKGEIMRPGKSLNTLAWLTRILSCCISLFCMSEENLYLFTPCISPVTKFCSHSLTPSSVQIEYSPHCLFVLISVPFPHSTVSQGPFPSLAKFSQTEALIGNCRAEDREKSGYFSPLLPSFGGRILWYLLFFPPSAVPAMVLALTRQPRFLDQGNTISSFYTFSPGW